MSAGISAASHDPGADRYRSSSRTTARSPTLVQTRTPTINHAPIATAPRVGSSNPAATTSRKTDSTATGRSTATPTRSALAPPGRTDGAPPVHAVHHHVARPHLPGPLVTRRRRRRAQVVAGLRWGSNVGNLLVGVAVLLPAAVLSVFLLVVAAGLLSPTRGRWRSARG